MLCLTLTLHPAVDRIVLIDKLLPGGTFDGQLLMTVPAGKGVNTARALRRLGIKNFRVAAAAWVGLNESAWFRHRLAEEGITSALFERSCATRFTSTLLERDWRETHIKEAMEKVSPLEEDVLLKMWRKTVNAGDAVAICGSAPKGTRTATLEELFRIPRAAGVKALIADTNGPLLKLAARAGLDGLKGNALEIGDLAGLGRPLNPGKPGDRVALRALLQKDGAPKAILMTMGARGALFANADGIFSGSAPKLPPGSIKSVTGCGDAATAGWLWALTDGAPPEETLRRAIACGSAKATSLDPGGLDAALVKQLLKKVRVERLNG